MYRIAGQYRVENEMRFEGKKEQIQEENQHIREQCYVYRCDVY